jgi:CRISPR/Cas system CMR-associated protein Cmr5 small subunit
MDNLTYRRLAMGMAAENEIEDYGKETEVEKVDAARAKITLEEAWNYFSNHMINEMAFDGDNPELAHDAYDTIEALVKNAIQNERKGEEVNG